MSTIMCIFRVVVLFMFTVINFHISMMIEFFCVIIIFAILFLLLSEPWHDKVYKNTNTKIRLHNRLGYTAAQSNEYLRLVFNG